MHEFPKLMEDISREHRLELDSLLESDMPWLRLNIDVPRFSDEIVNDAIQRSGNWREWWGRDDDYQVREWNGRMLFGPLDWQSFREDVSRREGEDHWYNNNQDRTCELNRGKYQYGWYIPENHPSRQFTESLFPDDRDLYIVNYHVLPPGGYLFPHRDPTTGPKIMNKVYVPLRWPEGNEIGFYKWGNMPAREGSAYLINNHKHVHWIINRSDSHRVVLAIGGNLRSIEELIKDSFLHPRE